MYAPGKEFFDTVRPMFRKLTTDQVVAMEYIVKYLVEHGVSRLHAAYILATIFHETAMWMEPIREGARRYGHNYTDAQSRRAIEVAVAKGLIARNYALPHPKTGHAYYGRGLVQITHYENYKKLGPLVGADLVNEPDRALEFDTALAITVIGMRNGLFTGKSLESIKSQADYRAARAMINGDVRKNGQLIADQANTFYDALAGYTLEVSNDPGTIERAWPPRWWPFRAN